ncbi:MAG: hypothetical protein AAF193_05180, partial [Bacteroidota bacterium]
MNWWKALGIILLIYVVVFTFTVPLGPGLVSSGQSSASPGEHEFTVSGYNTHFSDPSIQVILSPEKGQYISCELIKTDDLNLIATANIPTQLTSKSLDIFVNNDIDGTMLLENGLFCESCTVDESSVLPETVINVNNQESKGFHVPYQPLIFETIRNLMLHVPMWFAMFFLTGMSVIQAVRYLST